MLPWWGWMLLWVVLLSGSALLIAVKIRQVWRDLRATGRALSGLEESLRVLEQASQHTAEVSKRPISLGQPVTQVTAEWVTLRARLHDALADRRAARQPPWARRVH